MRHRRLRPAITGCEPTVDPPDHYQITSAWHFGNPHPEIRPALRPGQQPTGTSPASWTGRRTNASPSTTNAFRRLSHSFHDWTPSPRSGVNLTLPNLGAIPPMNNLTLLLDALTLMYG